MIKWIQNLQLDDVTTIEGESIEEIVVEMDDSSDIIVDGLPEGL